MNGQFCSVFLSSHWLAVVVQSDCFATPWTVTCQASLSMGFPRQEYWSGLPFPSPGDLPNPRMEPESPSLAGRFFTTEPPGKPSHQPLCNRGSVADSVYPVRFLHIFDSTISMNSLICFHYLKKILSIFLFVYFYLFKDIQHVIHCILTISLQVSPTTTDQNLFEVIEPASVFLDFCLLPCLSRHSTMFSAQTKQRISFLSSTLYYTHFKLNLRDNFPSLSKHHNIPDHIS